MRLALSRAGQLVRKWGTVCVSGFKDSEAKNGEARRKRSSNAAAIDPGDTQDDSVKADCKDAEKGLHSNDTESAPPPATFSKTNDANKALLQDDSSLMGPLTVAHLFFFLLVLIITDIMGPGEHRFYWGLLYLLLPTQLLVLYSEDGLNITHSFSYCMFYSVVLMRQPDFLGHVVMHYFKDMQATSDEAAVYSHGRLTLQSYKVRFFVHILSSPLDCVYRQVLSHFYLRQYLGHLRGENGRIHDENGDFIRKELSPGLHVVVSICFLVVMSLYLRVLKGVVARMGKSALH